MCVLHQSHHGRSGPKGNSMSAVEDFNKAPCYWLSCDWCLKNFDINGCLYRTKLKLGQTEFYCSHSCSCSKAMWIRRAKRIYRTPRPATRHRYRFSDLVLRSYRFPHSPEYRIARCQYGHPYQASEGRCLQCRTIYMRGYRARKKAAA